MSLDTIAALLLAGAILALIAMLNLETYKSRRKMTAKERNEEDEYVDRENWW